jgi:hypothetical protein
MQRSSLQKSMSKITPKKFYEIEPRWKQLQDILRCNLQLGTKS